MDDNILGEPLLVVLNESNIIVKVFVLIDNVETNFIYVIGDNSMYMR